MTRRLAAMGQAKYAGLVNRGKRHFNGVVRLHEPSLNLPLRWRKPRGIFVNPMSDLFHERVVDEWIDRIFAIMALCPQHVFQVLTKRPERMLAYLASPPRREIIRYVSEELKPSPPPRHWYHAPRSFAWPLQNVWTGVSVEDQAAANTRIPFLLQTLAAVRFLSVEPLLGPVDLAEGGHGPLFVSDLPDGRRTGISWVIVGAESGPRARPCDLDWVRSLRDQCVAAGVPYFYKQGGRSNRCSHDQKGGHFDCFPDDLKIREFPNVVQRP